MESVTDAEHAGQTPVCRLVPAKQSYIGKQVIALAGGTLVGADSQRPSQAPVR